MKRVCWYASVTWLLCVIPALGLAQVRTSGQLVGIVKDSSGAVIPKAALTLIDTTTGQTFETTSGADGGFVFPTLQPGTYTLTAAAGGFKPLTLQSIVIQTSRSTEIVVQFQIAGVSEEITVAGNLKEMFLHLTPADDLIFRSGIDAPTLRIDGMTVAGR